MKDLRYAFSKAPPCTKQPVQNAATGFLPSFAGGQPAFRGLLEFLQLQAGCMYLSDLHTPSHFPRIQRALRKITPDHYALREWNDAVWYITGQPCRFVSPRDAAEYLAGWIQESSQ